MSTDIVHFPHHKHSQINSVRQYSLEKFHKGRFFASNIPEKQENLSLSWLFDMCLKFERG